MGRDTGAVGPLPRTASDPAMSGDGAYHFQPDLFELLVEAIPRLVKSKRDLLLFFRGAGIPESDLHEMADQLATDPGSLSKFPMARELLGSLNAAGDRRIRQRRELLRRVTEFEDFAGCWDNERDAAKARVSEVRQLVNVKDAFTRLQIERDREAAERRQAARDRLRGLQAHRDQRESVKGDLYRLFGEPDPHLRGRSLEPVLNRLFVVEGIGVREAFVRRGVEGSVVEQIDGVVAIDGDLFLVEMKWLAGAVPVGDVSEHLVRVFNRADCGGILIAANGFSPAAIGVCEDALGRKTVVLVGLDEIVGALEAEASLLDHLRSRILEARLDRRVVRRR